MCRISSQYCSLCRPVFRQPSLVHNTEEGPAKRLQTQRKKHQSPWPVPGAAFFSDGTEANVWCETCKSIYLQTLRGVPTEEGETVSDVRSAWVELCDTIARSHAGGPVRRAGVHRAHLPAWGVDPHAKDQHLHDEHITVRCMHTASQGL